jgi:hypothetical protein
MKRLLMAILWPSFLVAGAAEGLFFSYFDPREFAFADTYPDIPLLGIYTLGFCAFWTSCALSSALTGYLVTALPRDENRK